MSKVVRITNQKSEYFHQFGILKYVIPGEDLCVLELDGDEFCRPFNVSEFLPASDVADEIKTLWHIANTVEGLWASGRRPQCEPDAFKLDFPELAQFRPPEESRDR